MENNNVKEIILDKEHSIYMGIDVHKETWSISLIHRDEIIKKATLPAEWMVFEKFLTPYRGYTIQSVYEAGFSGFWLHHKLEGYGVKNIVIAPNKLPVVVGDLVKTDKRDSLKLAHYLSKGLLKAIYIPSPQQFENRNYLRTREQLKRKRVATINQVKGLLNQYGLSVSSIGLTLKACQEIRQMNLPEAIRSTIEVHLKIFKTLSSEMKVLVREAERKALSETYRRDYELLRTVPGLGRLGALALLFEVGDWSRFPNEKTIAAFFGLTPSEYSSGHREFRGRITGQGKAWLRSLLIEASWRLIEKDHELQKAFLRLAHQTASRKKAIVAMARKLIIRIRSLILNQKEYQLPQVA